MGKSAPTPPPAPDPNTIINAATNANTAAAATQAKLNNVNYSGPQGTTTYNYDPGSGQFTENVLLNPTQQATEDALQAAGRVGANIANDQLTNIRGTLAQGLQTPTLMGSVHSGGLQGTYASGGPIQSSVQNTGVQAGIANPGSIQGQVAPTYSPFGTLGSSAFGSGGGAANAPTGTHSIAPLATGGGGSAPQTNAAPGQMTGLQHAQKALTRIDTAGHPAAFQKIEQAGVSAQDIASAIQGNPQAWAAYQQANGTAGVPKDVMALLQQGGGSAAGGAGAGAGGAAAGGSQAVNPLAAIASNPVASTQLATYAQARQMLDPQWQQAQEQQQAQLAAQGLNPNSAAYQNAMQLFGAQQNNAYNSAIYNAINAGDQEQNTLYGQNLASGQFANASQLQNYNELMGQAGLYNSANGQQFGQNLAQAQYGLAAQGQQNAQNQAAAGFYNTTQNQDFQQQLAAAQLYNSSAQQNFQNQAYAQQLPINDMSALMSSSQVGMPPSSPAQNTEVKAPDVSNAYALQQNGQQFAYTANQKNSQAGLGGLFSLGNSVLGLMGL